MQLSFDESDREVRVTAATVLMNVIDDYDPRVVRAMESGEITYPDEGTIARPTLEDSDSEDGPLGKVDIDAEVRAALKHTREAGKKIWDYTAPARDPGRHC